MPYNFRHHEDAALSRDESRRHVKADAKLLNIAIVLMDALDTLPDWILDRAEELRSKRRET